MELNIVGTNAITYPVMHVWDWRVAIYLFLGGMSGGLMSMSAINYIRPKKGKVDSSCSWQIPVIAPILLAIGLLFLNFDLERPFNAFWFYLAFKPVSPMSWGAWIVFVIYPLMILYALAALPDAIKAKIKNPDLRGFADKMQPHLFKLAKANFIAGILLAIYTGILLSSLVARPLWNSAILPMLFLCSGMSAGAAVMIIVAKTKETKLFFTKVDIWLIIAELIILLLFFYGHYTGDAAHRQAIMPFFSKSHEFFPYFLSILIIGICLPLAIVLKFLEVTGEHTEELTTSGLLLMNASAVLVLVGSAVIRFAMVYAGQISGYGGYM
ncbi:NrfD/PsrC family molybdoenzyme membrane anchor subunit [Candidatus Electronema sp. JM]|uniref:NrfD/PsrC family molybdoenzyme membrane anchor subunit n=1 Tax=Candidatus Electronema sp. JM TaxID=3401571 RepID=UPI003AA8E70A